MMISVKLVLSQRRLVPNPRRTPARCCRRWPARAAGVANVIVSRARASFAFGGARVDRRLTAFADAHPSGRRSSLNLVQGDIDRQPGRRLASVRLAR